MDYTNDPDGKLLSQLDNRHPNLHDYDALASKYGHLNGIDSGDKPGKGNGKGNNKGKNGEAPGQEISQWGKAIGTDGKGRPNLFELDLGKGEKVLTHVFWAD